MNVELACPACSESVQPSGSVIDCSCEASYKVVDGIADFVDKGAYYGEVPQQDMKELVSDAKERGWQKVLYDYFSSRHPFLYQIATDETRADWQFLLPIARDFTVLDVGAGWGTISVPLSRNCGQVVAMDNTLERLQFLKVRCEQDSISNVIPVRGDILAPPFRSAQFDLIVMSGVLEWVGESRLDENPETLQKKTLANVFRLLKPGGFFYLGIENKYGFKYMLGALDDHTGLKNISFLSRQEADEYSRTVKGKPYRTYTYSLSEYGKLLAEAGFSEPKFYYPIPDYKTATHIVPLDDTVALEYYLSNVRDVGHLVSAAQSQVIPLDVWRALSNLERVAVDLDIVAQFASSYIILSRKG